MGFCENGKTGLLFGGYRFLQNNRQKVLEGKGSVSHEAAVKRAGEIYDEFRKKQDEAYISDFDRETARYLKGEA